MRPPKTVLLAGANEQRLSQRAFLLRTRLYRVITATTTEEALAVLADMLPGTVDLLVADLPLPGIDAGVILHLKRQDPQLRTLVTSNHAGWYDPLGADVLLPRGSDSAAELIERIQALVRRKRGPSKKPPGTARLAFGSKSKKAAA